MTPTAMRNLYKQHGDPGDVAYYAVTGGSSKSRTSVLKPHPPLLIRTLYQDLRKIACARGEGSQKVRQAITERLMLSAMGSSWKSRNETSIADLNPHLLGEEARYLVRTMVHNLRVGAVRTTILSALARAIVLTPPRDVTISPDCEVFIDMDELKRVGEFVQSRSHASTKGKKTKQTTKEDVNEPMVHAHVKILDTLKRADEYLRRTFAQHPSYDDITTVLLQEGIRGVIAPTGLASLALGVPLLPTLGSPMRSLDDIYERLGANASWTAEMKYDGQRAQVHAWREVETVKIKIFSRHLEDMTDKVCFHSSLYVMTQAHEPSSIQTWYT
jgi:DNA ligase 1